VYSKRLSTNYKLIIDLFSVNMKWFSLSLALAIPSQAALRFGCSTISIQRLDPLVEPGKVPSAHVHQIVGGNAFQPSMPTGKDNNISTTATCTSCFFSEDFSNYWTGNLPVLTLYSSMRALILYQLRYTLRPAMELTSACQSRQILR
jgi:hypothetical protein